MKGVVKAERVLEFVESEGILRGGRGIVDSLSLGDNRMHGGDDGMRVEGVIFDRDERLEWEL
jgi:hypothetical protein